MNATDIVFPSAASLRLRRSVPAEAPTLEELHDDLAEGRHRLMEDMDTLRQREENLRVYEQQLRDLLDRVENRSPGAVTTRSPFAQDLDVSTGWGKLHRARELLEVEQRHLCDDRQMLRDERAAQQARELKLAAREARIAELEANWQAKQTVPVKEPRRKFGFTRSPFSLGKAAVPET